MTVSEIMQQAQSLSPQERKELVKLLVDSLEVTAPVGMGKHVHWGENLVQLLDELDMSEWKEMDFDDPVSWVKENRY